MLHWGNLEKGRKRPEKGRTSKRSFLGRIIKLL